MNDDVLIDTMMRVEEAKYLSEALKVNFSLNQLTLYSTQ